jgi:hypothetical protein
MNNYIIIILGWIVGQIAYASVSVYILQKNLPSIGYLQALREYGKKEFGSFIMALSALLVLLFIFPDYFDSTIKRSDLLSKETLTIKEKLIVYQRTGAVIVGGLCQHLLYVSFKKGKKAIQDYAAKNQVDSNVA